MAEETTTRAQLMCPFTGGWAVSCPLDQPGLAPHHLAWHVKNHLLADLKQARLELDEARLRVDGEPGVSVYRGEEMKAAVSAKCLELRATIPVVRGESWRGLMFDGDGRGASAFYEVGLPNGAGFCWHVRARLSTATPDLIVCAAGPWTSNSDDYWSAQAADRDRAYVIGGVHYRVRPDDEPGMKGFGGARHRIRVLATGELIVTRNLMYQGIVPPAWAGRLPDTAEFVPDGELLADYDAELGPEPGTR
jgi:hypothetical protein